ncbi:DUF2891 domain-containing protein [Solihabitans fulvus]|uniref:DUF2891 domain-containing protein n=1 Tax=Solihabitans fulvus TaxID=1892852 RepID=A0A5B2WYA7_9PSEU|nr:DUF2891 domain-containing protein [Solihabitans fulvus]
MHIADEWDQLLRANAAGYAEVALATTAQEFPNDTHHLMTGPDDVPGRPRERTPAFFGSFDWHSCVEMHWMLVRLLRVAGEVVPQQEIRDVLNGRLTEENLRTEALFIAQPGYRGRQRPYGWGWALALAHETAGWDDEDGRRWAANLAPLAESVTRNFLDWLPKATYPTRYGIHSNSAFGLSRAWPFATERARAGDSELLDAITAAAHRWYGDDTDYPGGWEPSGADFLSPALVEAELMAHLLPKGRFGDWLGEFLPGIVDRRPAALFEPAVVSDASDGHIAHLHGLNASRAWAWRRIAQELPAGDPRVAVALDAARTHADAALPHVAGDDYMVEHWLACYAVLLLS